MISQILLLVIFGYFTIIGYKKSGFYGIGSVLVTYGVIHIISSGFLGPNISIGYILLCVIMYFYYSSKNIEDVIIKTSVLITTLILVGFWRQQEPFSITARGGTVYKGRITALKCQKACLKEKSCKYIQVPINTSKSGIKHDCWIDNLGSNVDPAEKEKWDILEKKNFIPLKKCDESNRRGNRGKNYRGCQNYTVTGKPCQKWSSQSPHSHVYRPRGIDTSTWGGRLRKEDSRGLGNHNYCRNPSGHNQLWCYTNLRYKRWEDCSDSRGRRPT